MQDRFSMISAFLVALLAGFCSADNTQPDIRPAVLAGDWYPAGPKALRQSIEDYLSKAKANPVKGELVAIIVPHAGHTFSGPVAAHAYKLLENRELNQVIILGPSHQFAFRGASVGLQKGFQTPLGVVAVDQALGKKLLTQDSMIRWLPDAHLFEHSVEIQLPFLQVVSKQARMVPIVMGDDDFGTCSRLAQKLVETIKGSGKTLLVASSDLSHFHQAGQAKQLDQEFIRQVGHLDPEGLYAALQAGKTEACGRAPVLTVLLAAKALGADQALVLNYAHSGDITGDNERVVGYVSIALIKKSR